MGGGVFQVYYYIVCRVIVYIGYRQAKEGGGAAARLRFGV
jgi:hypothetical protein